MTATAPQAAVSWSSVAKRRFRGLARLAVFWFRAPLPTLPLWRWEGWEGEARCVVRLGDGAQVTKRKVKA